MSTGYITTEPDAIEAQARASIAIYHPGEPPTGVLRVAMAKWHIREATGLLARSGAPVSDELRRSEQLEQDVGAAARRLADASMGANASGDRLAESTVSRGELVRLLRIAQEQRDKEAERALGLEAQLDRYESRARTRLTEAAGEDPIAELTSSSGLPLTSGETVGEVLCSR